MQGEKPRLARLTAILTQLQSSRLVTASELAKKHEVSVRTIYRDIQTLLQSGIPIVTEEGRGYSIMEGYRLPPVMFTEEEANALITAQQIIDRNKDKSLTDQYNSAIEKIRSVMQYAQQDRSELLSQRLEIRNNYEDEQNSDYLIDLQTAITKYQVCDLHYHSLQKKKTIRKIEPFALVHTQENWVLIAYCRMRSDFRAFRLDCIERLMLLSDRFEPHKMTLQEYFDEMRKQWEKNP